MKKCPNCDQSFSVDNDYCPDDGIRLVDDGIGFPTSGEMPTQFVSRPPSVPSAKTSDSSRWLYLIIGLLTATVIVGGFVVIFEPFRRDKTNEAKNETVRTNNSASDANTPLPISNLGSSNLANTSVVPAPAAVLAQPRVSTVRVRFAKGAITSSPSGSLFPGEIKNYVLACRAGQQLTAAISTSNGCIVFADNSAVFRSITKKGDNSITVKNTCGGNGGYRLDITIL